MSENEKVTMGKRTFILSIIGAAAAASVLSFGMFALAGRLSGADKADNTQEQIPSQGQAPIPAQDSNQGQMQTPAQGQNQSPTQTPSQDLSQGQSSVHAQNQTPAQTPTIDSAQGQASVQAPSGNSGNAANSGILGNAGTPTNQTASDSYIGEESAWSIALTHAGLKETEISQKQIKLDLEDGIMVYEIEFEKGRTEYEYEINAVSGEIIKAEKD
ncbi:MAG: PepSY domain-containing protein [Lachnoclostridium sp.]|nr:PepSY domain-containing protein [Lachnospira sp.]MCM1248993.1 PepSY domain-containing protein [Lachnoclostridium sp.]